MSDIAQTDLSRYYDLLRLWTRFNRSFRAFSGTELQAIHRWLVSPNTGEFSPATIHSVMLSAGLSELAPVGALDAGCGYGGSMFALHAALGGRWHGITISRRQCAVGRKAARQNDVAGHVTFARDSYDAPQQRSFNLIYAIESLIHSVNPAHTIGNLASALRPGGKFIIVDDMPADRIAPTLAGDLAQFKRLWRCRVMPSAREWAARLEQADCRIDEIRDLSALTRPRGEREISQAIGEVAARRRWRDLVGLRRIGEAETGGLLLERLGRERAVAYTMIVARKRG